MISYQNDRLKIRAYGEWFRESTLGELYPECMAEIEDAYMREFCPENIWENYLDRTSRADVLEDTYTMQDVILRY